MLIWVNMPRIMSQWWHFSTFIAFLWRLSDYHTRYDAVSAPLNLHRMPNRLVHLPVRPPWHGALEFLVTPNFLQDAIGCRPALILSHAISCYYMLLVLLNFVPFDALLISVEVKNSQVVHISKLEEVTLWPCSKRWPVTSSKDDWNVGRIGPTATNGSTGRLEVLQVRAGIKPPQKDHWHWTDMSNMSNRFSTHKLHIQLRLASSRALFHEARQCRVLRAQIPRSDAHLACIFWMLPEVDRDFWHSLAQLSIGLSRFVTKLY